MNPGVNNNVMKTENRVWTPGYIPKKLEGFLGTLTKKNPVKNKQKIHLKPYSIELFNNMFCYFEV